MKKYSKKGNHATLLNQKSQNHERRQWFSFTSIMLVTLMSGFSCSSIQESSTVPDPIAKKPDTSRISSGDGIRLSSALTKNLKTESITETRRRLIEEIAAYNSGRKKHPKKMTAGGWSLSELKCEELFDKAPECTFLSTHWADSLTDANEDSEIEIKKTSRGKRQKFLGQLIKHMRAGNLSPLPDQHPGDYYRALKKFGDWNGPLADLATKLIESPECASPELYNYLGLKAEEFFPGPDYRAVAVSLYSRLDACTQEKVPSKYTQSARFRLGLLSMLDQKCDQASRAFEKLAKGPVGDYTTRAHYWNARCAMQDSNNGAYLTHANELFKTNPLGFHTLSLQKGRSVLTDNLGKPIDPIVQTRSESQPELNLWIAVVEDLDRMKEYGAVRKLLVPFKRNPEILNQLEPGVRLYLATFAYRAKDRLSIFRVLDSVFRTQSEYVVDSTLSLFYPLEHFDEIIAQVKGVNPFLIAALIRQESAFQADAKSRVGASGLMQLMPGTAKRLDRSVRKADLFKPKVNIRLGVRYFEHLVARFKGDVELALAAYNAGPEAVDRWLTRYPIENKMLFLDLIPYAETRNYVTLIGRNYFWYTQIYGGKVTEGDEMAAAKMTLPAVFSAMHASDGAGE